MDMATRLDLPGYYITEQLYAGPRTWVYRGIRETDQRSVVIKLLRNESPSFGELVQFRNQYTIAKNLALPGVIKPYSLEPYCNSHALVMEDFGGVALSKYVKEKAEGRQGFLHLPISSFLTIALQLCDILNGLYRHRIIHKDIKPANILINPDTENVKLIDFSIASLLPRETQEIQNPNVLEGTLAYLSPEQTGRMNRGIDYRSDFYSLGVTFYELLTGQLPFQTNDPMELVHCHIAKQPLACDRVNSTVPATLSAIVSKLMAKNAEDRYQSALGLKHDLEQCLTQWQEAGTITAFEIGQRDLTDRFLIPEKLYGRQAEVQTLLEAFDRVSTGNTELMLVAGFSGVGKTAVVNEVHKPIARQRGYFIKGKYDQFQRNIPFSAFVQAFRDLMGQLLSESNLQLEQWKAKILESVGENGQVLLEVIPELERIIGAQPPVPELSGSGAQNRFNLLMQQFVQVFTAPEHPLVLFLDDLQWADLASLKLLQLLMQDGGYLLAIGAYRDNEVSPTHPFMLAVDEMTRVGTAIYTISLQPLNQIDLNQLIADALSCEQAVATPLTELVYQKTEGNPFFATQFLKALYEDGQISFSWEAQHWQCNIAAVKALALTDDVVTFMALQLQKLPSEAQTVLKLAACIGAQFDLQTLAIVSQQSPEVTAAALWKALQEGMVIPTTETYKFFTQEDSTVTQTTVNPSYKFLHDRVQQAAYSLIPDDQKKVTHLKIGQLLLDSTPLAELELNIFDVVNQLNVGADAITQSSEQYRLARLNLIAGKKAKASTAYNAAIKYCIFGVDVLPKNSWQVEYETTFQLHQECAECEYLTGNFNQAEKLFDRALKHAQNKFDLAAIYGLQLSLRATQGENLPASLEAGLNGLSVLGMSIPATAEGQYALIETILNEIQTKLEDVQPATLFNLPEMTDPARKVCMPILADLWGAAYIGGNQPLTILSALLMLNTSLTYGNAESSGCAYCLHGMTLANRGDYRLAYEFGTLGRKLDRHFNSTKFIPKSNNVFGHTINPYHQPLAANLSVYQQSFQTSRETGDILFGIWAVLFLIWTMLLKGDRLPDVYAETEKYLSYVQQVNNVNMLHGFTLQQQFLLHLQGLLEETDLLADPDSQDILCINIWQKNNFEAGINWYFFLKLQLSYLYGRYTDAIKAATEAEKTLASNFGFFPIIQYHFYYPLSLAALYPTATPEEKQQYWHVMQQQQQIIDTWAQTCPETFLHKSLLLAAEMARLSGNSLKAIDHYDRAIALANAHQFINETALANELAAKFYLQWGKERIAQEYMIEAYYAYSRWGAKAKLTDLEQRYPQLLALILQHQSLAVGDAIFAASTHSDKTSTPSSIFEALDLSTILRASQALSSEIELEKLLTVLLQSVIENAGANQCRLLLLNEGNLDLVAQSIDGVVSVLESIAPATRDLLPHSLINYVMRTCQIVLINDVEGNHEFSDDCYFHQHSPKSLLSVPILNQSKLVGVLYLENTLTLGAFASDRVELLNLLCAQAAISLENARLYQQSQQALAELRTSKARFQKLADNLPGMIYQVCIAPDGSPSISYISSGCTDLYEVHPEEFMTGMRDLHSMEHPDDRSTIAQVISYSTQTLTPFELEWRIVTPSGKVKWVQAASRPERQADGSIVWDGVMMDMSDRKHAEKSLKLTQFAIDHASLPVWWVKSNGQISYVNGAACADLGYSQAEVLQRYVWDFNPDLPAEAWGEHWQELKEKGLLTFKTRNVNRLGNSYPVEVTVNYIELDGEEYNCAFVANISERKRAEALLTQRTVELEQTLQELQHTQMQMVQSEKMSALGQLVAGVAHEINNPVNFIFGNLNHADAYTQDLLRLLELYQQHYPTPHPAVQQEAEAIDLEFLTQDLPKLLISMKVGADRIQDIVASLRNFSRMDEAEMKAVDIHEGIDSTLMILQHRLKAKSNASGIEVIKIYEELPLVECYAGQLNQVFMNLLSNAIDALEESLSTKSFTVPTITIHTTLVNARKIAIQITDNGPGIPAHVKKRLFDPFFTTKPVGKGTGMGLSICYQIVTEKHQGTLQCVSEPGQGSTFIVTIPIQQT